MDGWRGTKLGYAGGRSGYFSNFSNTNDALRGTLGSSNGNPIANARQTAQALGITTTGLALAGSLVLAYAYRDYLKGVTRKIAKDTSKAVPQV